MSKTLHEHLQSIISFLTLLLLSSLAWLSPVAAAPSADLWPRWQESVEQNSRVVDHSQWSAILQKYVVTDHPSDINRFKYGAVTDKDKQSLNSYLNQLQEITVTQLNRREQKALWINLYNGLTVKLILDNYPVKSIMDVDISPGFFSNGPWGARLLTIEGERVSLNDIEHRILRPIFADNRVHYALNCASLGCPNLQPESFTGANSEQLLDGGARSYINHSRGVDVMDGKVTVSSIYKWFQDDFGGSQEMVVKHLLHYAREDLANALKANRGMLSFKYDWNLNK